MASTRDNSIGRRNFLKGILSTSALSVTGCSQGFKRDDLIVKNISIPLADRAKEFKNYRIAFLSDLHHGPFLPIAWLESTIDFLSSVDFDLLLLGGDYLNVPDDPFKVQIYPWHNQNFKAAMPRVMAKKIYTELTAEFSKYIPQDGAIAVYGNHDVWIAKKECEDIFKKSKIQLIENNVVEIKRGNQNLNIHCVADYWTSFPKLSNKQTDLDIILSHNPDFVSEVINTKQSKFDLALCGHTHGGQIRLPFFGGIYYNIADTKFSSGLVKVDDSYVFTSNGIGTVELPYRYNCPPEVCLITLV